MYDFTTCIVTYNTSTEELNKIINCFKKIKLKFKLWISDQRVEYIFNNSNKGFGAGHNVVLKKSIDWKKKSEFHLMINADVSF